jgi:hypothetical protein
MTAKRTQRRNTDDASDPVMVPRNEKALTATSPERARRLRAHLIAISRVARAMMDQQDTGQTLGPAQDGFASRVASTACGLCKGSCCRGGGDHAYLDAGTIARVRRARPDLNSVAVSRLYLERVPAVGYDGSCLFHAKQGCTLDRSLRSDVCNNYFCEGLAAYLASGDPTAPVMVIAGERDRMRTSPILIP